MKNAPHMQHKSHWKKSLGAAEVFSTPAESSVGSAPLTFSSFRPRFPGFTGTAFTASPWSLAVIPPLSSLTSAGLEDVKPLTLQGLKLIFISKQGQKNQEVWSRRVITQEDRILKEFYKVLLRGEGLEENPDPGGKRWARSAHLWMNPRSGAGGGECPPLKSFFKKSPTSELCSCHSEARLWTPSRTPCPQLTSQPTCSLLSLLTA